MKKLYYFESDFWLLIESKKEKFFTIFVLQKVNKKTGELIDKSVTFTINGGDRQPKFVGNFKIQVKTFFEIPTITKRKAHFIEVVEDAISKANIAEKPETKASCLYELFCLLISGTRTDGQDHKLSSVEKKILPVITDKKVIPLIVARIKTDYAFPKQLKEQGLVSTKGMLKTWYEHFRLLHEFFDTESSLVFKELTKELYNSLLKGDVNVVRRRGKTGKV